MASPNVSKTYKGRFTQYRISKPLYEPSKRERFWTTVLATFQFVAMAAVCGYFNQKAINVDVIYYAPWLFFCGINGSTMMCVFSHKYKRNYTTFFYKLLNRIGTCRKKSMGF